MNLGEMVGVQHICVDKDGLGVHEGPLHLHL
jgi:hypothetical protein